MSKKVNQIFRNRRAGRPERKAVVLEAPNSTDLRRQADDRGILTTTKKKRKKGRTAQKKLLTAYATNTGKGTQTVRG